MPPIRTVVNNAGVVLRKSVEAITDDEWRRVMAVNLDGTFFVTDGYVNTRAFTDLLRVLPIERDLFGGVIDYLEAVYRELNSFFDHYTNKANTRWISDVRVAVAEGEQRRAERANAQLDGVTQ